MFIPKIVAPVTVRWSREQNEYIVEEREVEVLTLHFQKGTMRVRYKADFFDKGKEKIHTQDIDSAPFFEQINIHKL